MPITLDKLGTYIVKLLNENLQVYLPGLGTFKKERVPAKFDENTNTFLAPSQRKILTTGKGSAELIINAISKAEGSNEQESEAKVKKLIGSILLELNEKGQCRIPNFGELTKEGDTITFIEDEQKEELPYYKNVDEIKLIEYSNKEPQVESRPPLVEDEINNKDEETEEDILPVEEFEPKRRSAKWLWPVIIILLIVAAGYFWIINSGKFEQVETSAAVVEESKNEILPDTNLSVVPSESEISSIDTLANSALENPEKIEEEALQTPKSTYEIIIVSFGKLADAEKYVENMNAKGYKIRILENKSPGNLYKVSYRSFTDESEAQLELNNVRETLAKEAWIYKTKK